MCVCRDAVMQTRAGVVGDGHRLERSGSILQAVMRCKHATSSCVGERAEVPGTPLQIARRARGAAYGK